MKGKDTDWRQKLAWTWLKNMSFYLGTWTGRVEEITKELKGDLTTCV